MIWGGKYPAGPRASWLHFRKTCQIQTFLARFLLVKTILASLGRILQDNVSKLRKIPQEAFGMYGKHHVIFGVFMGLNNNSDKQLAVVFTVKLQVMEKNKVLFQNWSSSSLYQFLSTFYLLSLAQSEKISHITKQKIEKNYQI